MANTEFVDLLAALMVEECGYSEPESRRLIAKHTDVVVQGIMHNRLGATVMAIQIREREENPPATPSTKG